MSERGQWSNWTDEALLEYEERLYDQERDGEDTWAERDEVLWEINRRGILRADAGELNK